MRWDTAVTLAAIALTVTTLLLWPDLLSCAGCR